MPDSTVRCGPSITLSIESTHCRRSIEPLRTPFERALSSISLGAMLGLATAMTHFGLSANRFVAVVFSLAAVSSATFLALTYIVYRYRRPRRLMPAYLRCEARIAPSNASGPK